MSSHRISLKKIWGRLFRRFKGKRTRKSTVTGTVALPQELYRSIIYHLRDDRKNLAKLSYVSRDFRHEAERVLYRSVVISGDHRRIEAWCRLVASNGRLAALVQCVTIGIKFEDLPIDFEEWLEVLGSGLRAIENLTE